jgi:beta-1,4-galactosyltransferase 1
LCLRVINKYSNISRLDPNIGRYFANCHEKQDKNPDRFVLYMGASSRLDTDGLNSIKYQLVKLEKTLLYTRIYVSYKDSNT